MKSGSSKKTIQENISEMIKAGYSRAQAVAASLENARKSKSKSKKKGKK